MSPLFFLVAAVLCLLGQHCRCIYSESQHKGKLPLHRDRTYAPENSPTKTRGFTQHKKHANSSSPLRMTFIPQSKRKKISSPPPPIPNQEQLQIKKKERKENEKKSLFWFKYGFSHQNSCWLHSITETDTEKHWGASGRELGLQAELILFSWKQAPRDWIG